MKSNFKNIKQNILFVKILTTNIVVIRRSVIKSLLVGLFGFSVGSTIGCSTMKSMVGMKAEPPPKAVAKDLNGDNLVRFSENANVPHTEQRQYRKMTRQRMEEESDLGSQAGSMWVMDGQGSYLFAQNKSRKEGDLLKVTIDSSAQQQIDTKVAVIKKLLKQLEDQELQKQQQLMQENSGSNLSDGGKPAEAGRAPASSVASSGDKKEKEEPIKIDAVPTKVVERMSDGNYRLKGAQPFMIGKREYKVIVTGIIRPEDYNDEGVSSAKLLDPQYDVVSLRRKE